MPINCAINVVSLAHPGGGGGIRGSSWWGLPPSSPNPDLISDRKIVIFHFHFQTGPLKSLTVFRPGAGRNYIIITYNGLKCKEKVFLKFISKRILLFRFCLFGIEAIYPFLQSRIPSKTIPEIRPK